MAFFERADERDPLILCNICDVKCSERSITSHRMKCAERKPEKFKSKLLTRCPYDSGHIVVTGKLDIHYEFCVKRQSSLVSELQKQELLARTDADDSESFRTYREPVTFVDEWQPDPEGERVVAELSKLKLM